VWLSAHTKLPDGKLPDGLHEWNMYNYGEWAKGAKHDTRATSPVCVVVDLALPGTTTECLCWLSPRSNLIPVPHHTLSYAALFPSHPILCRHFSRMIPANQRRWFAVRPPQQIRTKQCQRLTSLANLISACHVRRAGLQTVPT